MTSLDRCEAEQIRQQIYDQIILDKTTAFLLKNEKIFRDTSEGQLKIATMLKSFTDFSTRANKTKLIETINKIMDSKRTN